MRNIGTPLILGSGTFIALLGAAFAQSNAFRLHMSVLVAVLGIATIICAASGESYSPGGCRYFWLYGRPDPGWFNYDHVLSVTGFTTGVTSFGIGY